MICTSIDQSLTEVNPKRVNEICSSRLSEIFLFYHFSEKIRLGIPCESSALQTIHMKCQFYFL